MDKILTPTDLLVKGLDDSLKTVVDHRDDGCNVENHKRVVYHMALQSQMLSPTFQNTELILERVNAIASAVKAKDTNGDSPKGSGFFSFGKIKAYGIPAIILAVGLCVLGLFWMILTVNSKIDSVVNTIPKMETHK